MKKGVIIAIIASALVLAGGGITLTLILLANSKPSDDDKSSNDSSISVVTDDKTKPQKEETPYLSKYAEYLRSNYFEDDAKIEAFLYDQDNDGIPELMLRHNSNTNTQVLYLSGDSVRASEDFRNASFSLMYDMKEEKPKMYLETSRYYTDISEVLLEKKQLTEIKRDNDTKFTAMSIDARINAYEIKKDSIDDDMAKLESKYEENPKLISDSLEKEVLNDVKEIKDSILIKDENGIHNSKFNAVFGSYSEGEDHLTLHSDGSAEYCWRHCGDSPYKGSYIVENDKVKINMDTTLFSVRELGLTGDNQFTRSGGFSSDRVFNLE